jgi:hypothetical protein
MHKAFNMQARRVKKLLRGQMDEEARLFNVFDFETY